MADYPVDYVKVQKKRLNAAEVMAQAATGGDAVARPRKNSRGVYIPDEIKDHEHWQCQHAGQI